MENKNNVIDDNLVVSLAYELRLEDGKSVSQANGEDLLEYLHGNGNIIPGLEKELYGMRVGEEKKVVLHPRDGYGLRINEEVVDVAREQFPDEFELEVGRPVSVSDQESGEKFIAYITEVKPDLVVLDFNHPLAGETLYFKVKVMDLRQASTEELSHGHVHNDDSIN